MEILDKLGVTALLASIGGGLITGLFKLIQSIYNRKFHQDKTIVVKPLAR